MGIGCIRRGYGWLRCKGVVNTSNEVCEDPRLETKKTQRRDLKSSQLVVKPTSAYSFQDIPSCCTTTHSLPANTHTTHAIYRPAASPPTDHEESRIFPKKRKKKKKELFSFFPILDTQNITFVFCFLSFALILMKSAGLRRMERLRLECPNVVTIPAGRDRKAQSCFSFP